MKRNVVLIVLAAVAAGLLVAFVQTRKQAADDKRAAEAVIEQKSKELLDTKGQLESQKKVNDSLETDLKDRNAKIETLNTDLSKTRDDAAAAKADADGKIAKLTTDLQGQTEMTAATKKSLDEAKADIEKRDAKITELEGKRDELTVKIEKITGNVQSLEKNIAETQRKLTASEGDREFLIKELKRLQTEKAELERQINDLAFLREQIKQLKDEMSAARRLDWIRRGLYGMEQKKGSQILNEGFSKPAPKPAPGAGKLDVELNQKGDVKVNSTGTNAPPAAPK